MRFRPSREERQHPVGRAPHDGTRVVKHDRPFDQNRVLDHGFDELVVGDRGVVEAKLRVNRLLRTDQLTWPEVERPQGIAKLGHGRGCAQVFDHDRFEPPISDQLQRLSGFAAAGIVPNP